MVTPSFTPDLPMTRAVEQLLSIRDEAALEAALADVEPAVAARALALAPTLEQKTALVWALDDRQRREVLDRVPPALVGVLVQNAEEDNRYLLGDLSLEQFRALMRLCSPERQWYWVTTALSFTDARANLLPLLLPTRELVEILLTRSEFEEHLRLLGDYPLEDQRIPPELLADPAQALVDLFGADNLLRQFPVTDPALEKVLQTVLEYDPDRYVDLIREGLRAADYTENHPDEWTELTETPVLLDQLEPIERPTGEALRSFADVPDFEVGPPISLVPVGASPLTRMAELLPPAAAQRIAGELQQLYVRQAIAEGGSFLDADLRRMARSVEAYLMLGLQAESGGQPERAAELLRERPLSRISQSGARVVEALRQVALRLQPLERVMSPEQRALVRSILRPRLTVSPEGLPRLQLLPSGNLPPEMELEPVAAELEAVAAWISLVRGVGIERTARALAGGRTVDLLLEELTIAAAFFGRIDPGLIEPADRPRFVQRFLSRVEREPLSETLEAIRRAVEAWAAERRAEPAPLVSLFERALERIGARELRGG